jgi:hypothetical protein
MRIEPPFRGADWKLGAIPINGDATRILLDVTIPLVAG